MSDANTTDAVSGANSDAGNDSAATVLRIVGGNPTDEEIAVLVTVFAASGSAGAGDADPLPRDDWGRPSDLFRPQWGAPTSFTNLGF